MIKIYSGHTNNLWLSAVPALRSWSGRRLCPTQMVLCPNPGVDQLLSDLAQYRCLYTVMRYEPPEGLRVHNAFWRHISLEWLWDEMLRIIWHLAVRAMTRPRNGDLWMPGSIPDAMSQDMDFWNLIDSDVRESARSCVHTCVRDFTCCCSKTPE